MFYVNFILEIVIFYHIPQFEPLYSWTEPIWGKFHPKVGYECHENWRKIGIRTAKSWRKRRKEQIWDIRCDRMLKKMWEKTWSGTWSLIPPVSHPESEKALNASKMKNKPMKLIEILFFFWQFCVHINIFISHIHRKNTIFSTQQNSRSILSRFDMFKF